ncbi:MAG: ATP-binding protein [Thiohalospira sp.]
MNYKREKYHRRIEPYVNKQLIKVITGQRRVGKSYFIKQIKDNLHQEFPENQIIFIDKEKYEFDFLTDYHQFLEYVKDRSSDKMNYLFIDEVQEIQGFEKALRSLLSEGNYDIYCTGSNSAVFSGELATYLSGRQIEIRIHSLSFVEFIDIHQLPNNRDSLNSYIKYGGLPYLINLPWNDEVIFDYLKNIYATILFRDVISRNKIRDIPFLENIMQYLADNTGSVTSANKIADYMKSQKNSKSVPVIINYIDYIKQAYFIKGIRRQEIQGKKIFESGEKFYFTDLGLRNSILGYRPDDIGKIIENIVCNHLQYLGYSLYVGKNGQKEIDFIAKKNNEYVYIQVAYLLSSRKVIDREFGNLKQIPDNYPKYVVTMDDFPTTASYDGIKHISLLEFLNLNDL